MLGRRARKAPVTVTALASSFDSAGAAVAVSSASRAFSVSTVYSSPSTV